ncbi:hypothetical protein K502DRAFT_339681 [Neoconidiobolus thromboides FSU 785]|nr:hypothetical protein K502DRAFT_339681 [Neoconidiobolus thromboides FSU 785]
MSKLSIEVKENSEKRAPFKHMSSSKPSFVIEGSIEDPVFIGRHEKCTYQISKDSKKISRNHCIIRYDKTTNKFLMKVMGANGIKYHGKMHQKNDIIQLSDESMIDCVGIKLLFKEPKMEIEETILPIFSPSSQSEVSDSNVMDDALITVTKVKRNFSVDSCDNISVGKEVMEVKKYEVKTSLFKESESILTPLSQPQKNKTNRALAMSPTMNPFKDRAENKPATDIIDDVNTVEKVRKRVYQSSPLFKSEPKSVFIKTHSKSDSLDSHPEKIMKKSEHRKTPSTGDVLNNTRMITQATCTKDDELLIDLILQTFAEMDKRTPVSLSQLHSELSRVYPETFTQDFLKERLDTFPMFTEVPHNGPIPSYVKDEAAYYYYLPSKDWNQNRRIEIGTLIRKPRGCTLSSKQYYFKPPPKLPKYHQTKSRKS